MLRLYEWKKHSVFKSLSVYFIITTFHVFQLLIIRTITNLIWIFVSMWFLWRTTGASVGKSVWQLIDIGVSFVIG